MVGFTPSLSLLSARRNLSRTTRHVVYSTIDEPIALPSVVTINTFDLSEAIQHWKISYLALPGITVRLVLDRCLRCHPSISLPPSTSPNGGPSSTSAVSRRNASTSWATWWPASSQWSYADAGTPQDYARAPGLAK
jgi:hypothetical protein